MPSGYGHWTGQNDGLGPWGWIGAGVAVAAGGWWLLEAIAPFLAYALAALAGVAVIGTGCVVAVLRRGSKVRTGIDWAEFAALKADRAAAALPPGEVHYHTHYEEHHHHHADERQLHIHAPDALPAAQERRAIPPRHVTGTVINRRDERVKS